MGITFAYELGLKSFLYEKSSTQKVTSEFNRGNPVKYFQNSQKPNRKKVTGLLRTGEAKKFKKIKFSNGAPLLSSRLQNSKILMAHRGLY